MKQKNEANKKTEKKPELESLWCWYKAEFELEHQNLERLLATGGFKQKTQNLLEALKAIKTTWGLFSPRERLDLVNLCLESLSHQESIFLDYDSLKETKHDDVYVRDMQVVSKRLNQKLDADIEKLETFMKWVLPPNSVDSLNRQLVLSLLNRSITLNPGKTITKYGKHPAVKFTERVVEALHSYVDKYYPDEPAAKRLLQFESVQSTCLLVIKENILGKKPIPGF